MGTLGWVGRDSTPPQRLPPEKEGLACRPLPLRPQPPLACAWWARWWEPKGAGLRQGGTHSHACPPWAAAALQGPAVRAQETDSGTRPEMGMFSGL